MLSAHAWSLPFFYLNKKCEKFGKILVTEFMPDNCLLVVVVVPSESTTVCHRVTAVFRPKKTDDQNTLDFFINQFYLIVVQKS
jgi:hypothetical protein